MFRHHGLGDDRSRDAPVAITPCASKPLALA